MGLIEQENGLLLTYIDKLDIGRSKGVGIYVSLFCSKAGVVAGTARQTKRKILTAVMEPKLKAARARL